MITATAVGRVERPGKIVSPEGKTAFCACTIVSEKTWGGKTYSNYVDIITYGRDIHTLAPQLTKGTLVCVSGECSAVKSKDGQYVNVKIMGTPQILSAGAPSRPSAPSSSTQSTRYTPSTPEPEEDDEVPF